MGRLTESQVRTGRAFAAQGTSCEVLASRYGVTYRAMKRALEGVTWRHIKIPEPVAVANRTRQPGKKLPPKVVAEIRREYLACRGSQSELALWWGVSPNGVWAALHKRSDVTDPPPLPVQHQGGRRIMESLVDPTQLRQMRVDGWSLGEIAQEIGVHRSSVLRALERDAPNQDL